MTIQYLSDEEYENIFVSFCSFRQKLVSKLEEYGLLKSNYIMDLAAGHGFLSFAVEEKGYKNYLVDIGLINDLENFRRTIAIETYNSRNLQFIVMDSSKMAFRENRFDFIVNFLGLEDINMTIGKSGVISTLKEADRILKVGGILEIAILAKGSKPSSILNWKIWKYIGLNSRFYSPEFYINKMLELGLRLKEKFMLRTNKKMTSTQAKEEILFACEEAPKIFKRYNVYPKPFKQVWNKYKKKIKKQGLGFYPIILILIFEKQS